MKNSKNRILSLLLAIFMLLSNVAPAMAANTNNDSIKGLDKAKIEAEVSKALKESSPNATDEELPEGKIRVIVELNKEPLVNIANSLGKTVKDLSNAQVNTYERQMIAEQDSVKAKLLSADIQTYDTGDDNRRADYSYTTVLNGFATYIDAEDLEKLQNLREVKNVYIANEWNKPADVPQMITSNDMIGSTSAWSLGYKGEGMVVAVLDTGYDINHKDFNITDPSKVTLTENEVNKRINAYGLPGKYFTNKFPYAYNYYDKTMKIINEGANHGQHVAGTVAANGSVKGVAPEAQILGMKVFSDDPMYSTTFSDVYVKAIDDSVKLGADSINMSLGSPAGRYIYGSIEDVAILRARDAGVQVTISAGNEHSIINGIESFEKQLVNNSKLPLAKYVDTSILGSPSLYQGNISVASIENTNIQARVFTYTSSGQQSLVRFQSASSSPKPWEVLTGTYTANDFVVINKDNIAAESKPGDTSSFVGKNVAGKIVLVERGNSFADTIVNAQNNNAKAVIVYNNVRANNDDVIPNMAGGDLATVPFFAISRKEALPLIEIIEKKGDLEVSFPNKTGTFPNEESEQMSDFSSIGPTPELGIKPEISAPGGQIYSTDNGDEYTTMSGTSMAAPHVAGGAAVIAQRIQRDLALFGNLSKEERGKLSKILMLNTATPATDKEGRYFLIRQQGAGLMNLLGATTTDTYVVDKKSGEAKVELGSFTDNKIVMNLTIYNKSNELRRYKVSANAITDEQVEVNGYLHLTEKSRNLDDAVVLTQNEIIVPRRGKKEIRVTIDLSKSIAENNLSLQNFVEGFVFLESTQGKPTLSVPYLGFYGNFEELNVLDEPVYNLLDDDKSNDPMFNTTGLYYQENGKAKLEVPSYYPSYFNPKIKGYGNSGLVMQTTALRSFDRIEFSIEDKNGNTLLNLGQTEGGRKFYHMSRGTKPYQALREGMWDGTINGKALEAGQTVYYTAKAYYQANSKPQVIRFEVSADDTYPIVKDINGDMRSRRTVPSSQDVYYQDIKGADVRLAFDKDTRTVTFEAYDTISGVNEIILSNPASLSTANPKVELWQGQKELDTIRELVDKETGLYRYTITLPEEGYDNHIIHVQVVDKAMNIITSAVVREEIEPVEDLGGLTSIYSFNENTRILRLFIKPGGNVFLIPFKGSSNNPVLDWFNLESFEDDDYDGIIDAKLFKKYKAKEVFSLVSGGSQIKYVLPVEEDKSKPLPPILNPATTGNTVTKISGMAYEAHMTIRAYQNGELIGESKSDDDGLFTIDLAGEKDVTNEITVTATRDVVGLTSEPAILVQAEVQAPSIDGNILLPEQTEIRGDAYRAFAEVVFEKENADGTREEFGRTTAYPSGRFAYLDNDFSFANVGIGDKVVIYSLKDGVKSPETTITVEEGEGLDHPDGKLTMYINSPDILSTFNGNVSFDLVMFGWDNVDRVTFGEHNIPVKVNNYAKINDPKTQTQVWYGKAFTAKRSLKLDEGYYELPIIAHDDKNKKEYGITRRFWVDKTKPEVKVVTSAAEQIPTVIDSSGNQTITLVTNDNEVPVTFYISDNGPDLALFRNDTLIANGDNSSAYGYALNPSKLEFTDVIRLGNETEATYEYTTKDIAQNQIKVTIKVTREPVEETASKNPVLTANNRTLFTGGHLDLMYGVKAIDQYGRDITHRVQIKSNPELVDTSKPGTYEVTYSVRDEDGYTSQVTVEIKVVQRKADALDYTALRDTVAKAKEKEAQNYTIGSYRDLQQAIADAEYLLKSVSATKEDLAAMVEKLNKLMNNLVEISHLKQIYDTAADLIVDGEEVYTKETFENLIKYFEEAKKLLEDENSNQEDVDYAFLNLSEAINELIQLADKSILRELYNKIANSINSGEISEEKYSKESIDKLIKALEEAKAVLEKTEVSNEEIDLAYSNLIQAYNSLEEKPATVEVNKDKLLFVYTLANGINLENYTDESGEKLRAELINSYNVLNNTSASQQEVDKALENLTIALDGLVDYKVNLEKALKEAEELSTKEMTETGKQKLTQAISQAKAIFDNKVASREEIDKATEDLNTVIDQVSKTETNLKNILQELVDEAEKMIVSGHYADSYTTLLRSAQNSAKSVIRNRRSSDTQYQKNIENMREKIALVKASK